MSEFHSFRSSSDAATDATTDLETLKAEFITAITHEIRTPLSVILLAVELLRQHGPNCSEAQQQAYLRQIREAALQINQQLNAALVTIGADPA